MKLLIYIVFVIDLSVCIMFVVLSDEIRLVMLTYIEKNKKIIWIVSKLNVSERQIKKMKFNFRLYASIIFSARKNNLLKIIDEVMKKAFFDWINHRLIIYLNEMCLFLYDEFDIVVIIWIVKRFFKRIDWTHKKIDIIFL